MRPLWHMYLAAFVVYARAEDCGICMSALYFVDGLAEPVGIRFCLN